MDVFTSLTLNYLPKARILAKTLKKFHSDWKFHLIICDRINHDSQIPLLNDDALFDRIVWVHELDIPNIYSWIFKHTIVELCTAVKGPFLRQLVLEGSENILYIDPDIAIFNDLTYLEDTLDNHSIILTPHLLDYTNNKQSIQDNEIAGALRHGIFNLGFLGINAALDDGHRFSDWWCQRLLDYCYADYDKGLFTDQKWCDLIPSFFEDYFIIRDPGYDVASWNLDCRSLSIAENGQLKVNKNYPLRFYHFTGYDSGAGANVINQLTQNENAPIVKEIWNWYNRELYQNGHAELGNKQSKYEFFDNGITITKEMRLTYRDSEYLQTKFINPYKIVVLKEHFYSWWKTEHKIIEEHSHHDILQAPINIQLDQLKQRGINHQNYQASIYSEMLLREKINRAPEYKSLSFSSIDGNNTPVKLIAFYLPQFHPIPENDLWWGKGFTEWNNVTKAVPQFVNHYQPHLPGELGFYDLRLKDTQYRQIELAKQYGIFGFAFYCYWFSGKKLLDHPINQFLENKDMDMPFCLVWANESWTRRWDGLENDILIGQEHSPQTDELFIEDMEKYLQDNRYIRINDRPVIIVYRGDLLPEPQNTTQIWRDYCLKNHLGNPYLIAAQTFGFTDPTKIGFDAAVQFPPHNELQESHFNINSDIEIANPTFSGNIYSYEKVVEYFETGSFQFDYPLFRSLFPSWDNEPRRPARGTIYAGSTPQLYQRWLEAVCYWTIENHPENQRLVFINAWNEWAEGAHLEPDQKFGYAYLQATLDALDKLKATSNL